MNNSQRICLKVPPTWPTLDVLGPKKIVPQKLDFEILLKEQQFNSIPIVSLFL
jgi:hypothetical protein